MRRYRMTVAYDGTDFNGWQSQPGLRSVQGDLLKALAIISGGETIRIHGSGRTDRGVHARGQVFHFDASRDYPPAKWVEALNGVLERDVRILDAEVVANDFHSRIDAMGKEYRYFMYFGRVMPPDLRRHWVQERRDLDLDLMREACSLLEGEHDFLSFSASRGKALGEENTVRTLYHLLLEPVPDGLVIRAAGSGFLYKMVRQLVGCLRRVGRHEMTVAEVAHLLEHPKRTHDAPSARPHGLFLWKVWYHEEDAL